jgi:hypothetical protein
VSTATWVENTASAGSGTDGQLDRVAILVQDLHMCKAECSALADSEVRLRVRGVVLCGVVLCAVWCVWCVVCGVWCCVVCGVAQYVHYSVVWYGVVRRFIVWVRDNVLCGCGLMHGGGV